MKPVVWARIGVVLVLWAEWMGPLRPVHHMHQPGVLLVGAVVWIGSAAMLLGVFSRAAAALTGVSVLGLCVLATALDVSGGGVALGSLEAWMLGICALGLAFTPCGAGLSVDATWRAASLADDGGRWLLRALLAATFLGLATTHADAAFLTGQDFSGIAAARYPGLVLPPAMFAGLAIVWWIGELAVGVAALWGRWRKPVFAVGLLALVLLYSLFFLGSFPAVVAVAMLGSLDCRGETAG